MRFGPWWRISDTGEVRTRERKVDEPQINLGEAMWSLRSPANGRWAISQKRDSFGEYGTIWRYRQEGGAANAKNTWRDLLVLKAICATNSWFETTRKIQESMLLVEIEECAHASRRETQRKSKAEGSLWWKFPLASCDVVEKSN